MIREVTVVYVTGEIRMAGVEARTDGDAVFKLMRRGYMRNEDAEILTIICGTRKREPANDAALDTKGEWRT